MCTKIKNLRSIHNNKITTCAPFAKTLKKLQSNHITNDGLMLCANLKILIASNNPNITTCAPFAKTLRVLHARNNCGITDAGLLLCTKLRVLHASCNCILTTCAPFAKTLKDLDVSCTYSILADNIIACINLETLNVSCRTDITDSEMRSFTKLRNLYATCNENITTCEPFASTLKKLDMSSRCGITNDGLNVCTNLTHLIMRDRNIDCKIILCDALARKLEILDIHNNDAITDNNIAQCVNLKELNASSTVFITTCLPFMNTLQKLHCYNSKMHHIWKEMFSQKQMSYNYDDIADK